MRAFQSIAILLSCLALASHAADMHGDAAKRAHQEDIVDRYLRHGAWRYPLYSHERDSVIALGLREDTSVAYLWQQRGMPLMKQRKYDLGMEYVDHAVWNDREEWLNYRAFLKCIFVKSYKDALVDFAECKREHPDAGVMDHSYDFYIGLCELQLNRYAQALATFQRDVEHLAQRQGSVPVHFLDYFYLGIARYEMRQYTQAVDAFDRALAQYPRFSDAKYYKGICLRAMGDSVRATALFDDAKRDAAQGFTFNEDNAAYELYPYQVKLK